MITVNKVVKGYIKKLPVHGSIAAVVGSFFFIVVLNETANDLLINVPFAILGLILGYHLADNIDPGGRVTFHYYTPRDQTEDEKTIYQLVTTHKSKRLLQITTLLLIILVSVVAFLRYPTPNTIDIYYILWITFWMTFSMLMAGTGIKYISAWWNIRKHLK